MYSSSLNVRGSPQKRHATRFVFISSNFEEHRYRFYRSVSFYRYRYRYPVSFYRHPVPGSVQESGQYGTGVPVACLSCESRLPPVFLNRSCGVLRCVPGAPPACLHVPPYRYDHQYEQGRRCAPLPIFVHLGNSGKGLGTCSGTRFVRLGKGWECSRGMQGLFTQTPLTYMNLPQPGPRQNCKCSPLLSDWHPRAVSTVDGADPRPSAERATTKKALQPLSQRLLSIE